MTPISFPSLVPHYPLPRLRLWPLVWTGVTRLDPSTPTEYSDSYLAPYKLISWKWVRKWCPTLTKHLRLWLSPASYQPCTGQEWTVCRDLTLAWNTLHFSSLILSLQSSVDLCFSSLWVFCLSGCNSLSSFKVEVFQRNYIFFLTFYPLHLAQHQWFFLASPVLIHLGGLGRVWLLGVRVTSTPKHLHQSHSLYFIYKNHATFTALYYNSDFYLDLHK